MKKIKVSSIKIGDWILIKPKVKDGRWAITCYKKNSITYYSNQKGKFEGHLTHKTTKDIEVIIFSFYNLYEKDKGFQAFKLNKKEIEKLNKEIILYNLK